jgi:hypothetical protein
VFSLHATSIRKKAANGIIFQKKIKKLKKEAYKGNI